MGCGDDMRITIDPTDDIYPMVRMLQRGSLEIVDEHQENYVKRLLKLITPNKVIEYWSNSNLDRNTVAQVLLYVRDVIRKEKNR